MSSASTDQNFAQQVHVLLVDHDAEHEASTKAMLEYFSYKVTTIRLASVALSVILKGNQKFDLLLENINSPDSCGFKLLQAAVKMDLLVILLSNDDDPMTTMRALQEGAIFCIQKPIPIDIIEYLWQHVLREKRLRHKENERVKNMIAFRRLQNGLGEEIPDADESYISKRKGKSQKCVDKSEDDQDFKAGKSKKKGWVDWTQELHEKFMDAVKQLGEGRCYPKEILELMGMPGLTRMQVASHLQKCRCGTWQSPEQRKLKLANPDQAAFPYAKPRRFGTMPHLDKDDSEINLTTPDYHHEMSQDQYSYIDSSMGNNVLGNSSEELLTNQVQDPSNFYNPFGHGKVIGTSNMGHDIGLTLALDSVIMSNKKIVFDAQSVTHSSNTSPNQINNGEDVGYGFPNKGWMIHITSTVQHLDSGTSNSGKRLQALQLDPPNYNQVSNMRGEITNQWSQVVAPKKENV